MAARHHRSEYGADLTGWLELKTGIEEVGLEESREGRHSTRNIETSFEKTGVLTALGLLEPGALVTDVGLARLFGRDRATIRRMIQRGEIPTPIRMMGKPTWTVGSIRKHIEDRLSKAAEDARILADIDSRGR